MATSTFKSPQFWDWVNAHLGDNNLSLRLTYNSAKMKGRDAEIDYDAAITQIDCRKRFGRKLSETLRRFPDFYFPSTLAGEQATSDALARFKERLYRPDDTLVDFTAGLGIDVTHAARKVEHATAVEQNSELTEALKYNSAGLGIENLQIVEGDSTQLVESLEGTVAYIDPARRDDDGGRVYSFADCRPDVLQLLPRFKGFRTLIIKASPMLDITKACVEIEAAAPVSVSRVYVLGTTTECKEIDIVVNLYPKKEEIETPTILACTILSDNQTSIFEFTREEENAQSVSSDETHTFRRKPGDVLVPNSTLLYMPYPSVLKAAPNRLLATRFGLSKFHANTHLYYGSQYVADFPGEVFDIVEVIPWQSKNLKRLKSRYPVLPAVTTRNFGMTGEQLRTRLGIRSGSTNPPLHLFGIGLGSGHTDRLLVVAKRH